MKRICVFCGSSSGARPEYTDAAITIGTEIVRRGLELVYGGGRIGLMGVVADSVLAAGGRAIGVIPKALMTKEIAHAGLSELHVVESMHERKAMMADRTDAFIALPGGFGTMEEFFEVLTWAQLGLHRKPCALLNTAGYYDGLLALFETFLDQKFVLPEHRTLVLDDTDPLRLLDRIAAYTHPSVETWLTDEDET